MNKDVNIKLRGRLFGAMVSPTVLFGLRILPLTKQQGLKFDKNGRSIHVGLDTQG